MPESPSDRRKDDALEVLTGRHRYLGALLDGPLEKRDLVDGFDVSRSTIDRAVRDLERVGFVERDPDGYRATLYGRLAATSYEAFRQRVAGLSRAQTALDGLSAETPLDPALFEGANVVLPEQHAPDRPLLGVLDLVKRAERVRGFSPTVVESYVDLFHRRVVDGALTADIVLADGVLGYLLSEYSGKFTESLDTPRLTVHQTRSVPPFGLLLIDAADGPEVGVVVYGQDGITGYIENDTRAAVDWAERLYRTYRDDADRLDAAADG